MARCQFCVVFDGKVTGIYKSWEECKAQVCGYKGNSYRGFETFEEAFAAYATYHESESFDDLRGSVLKPAVTTELGESSTGTCKVATSNDGLDIDALSLYKFVEAFAEVFDDAKRPEEEDPYRIIGYPEIGSKVQSGEDTKHEESEAGNTAGDGVYKDNGTCSLKKDT